MTKLVALAVPALAAFAFAHSAHAARGIEIRANTAGELADLCAANPNSPRGDAEINYCHGFAQGEVDAIIHYQGANKAFCFPRPAPTRTETMNQFVHWVRAEPAHAQLAAAPALYQFLRERYPCGK